jgi:hypothetical protein
VGWYLASVQLARLRAQAGDVPVREVPVPAIRSLALQAAGLATVSLVVLAVIWLPQLPVVADSSVTATEWGVPLILYGSQASKAGWMVLMLVISPVAQFAVTLAAAAVRLSLRPR